MSTSGANIPIGRAWSGVTATDFDPLSPAQRESPYDLYAEARAHAPVVYAERYGFWVVTRHEDVLRSSRTV